MVESLSSDILTLQRLIKKEKEDRKKETEDLKKRVGQLEKDKQDLRRVMLVRSLATATQFAITEKFSGWSRAVMHTAPLLTMSAPRSTASSARILWPPLHSTQSPSFS